MSNEGNNSNQQPTEMAALTNLMRTMVENMEAMRRSNEECLNRLERPRMGPIRMPPLQNQPRVEPETRPPPRPQPGEDEEAEVEDDEMDDEPEDILRPRNRRVDPLLAHQPRGAAPRDPTNDIKLTPSSFAGKADPEAYLEWERSMEKIFECYQYSEVKKVAVAAAQLTGNASAWWDRTVAERRRLRFLTVSTWANMKILMRARYVPDHFQRDLLKRFRKLMQGQRSVEDYYMEFEKLMNLLELEDTEEALMAQFVDGLQERIQRKVEPLPYTSLVELYHLAVKVESKNKRKASISRRNTTHPTQTNPAWQASSSRPQHKGKGIAVESRFQSKPAETPKTYRPDHGKSLALPHVPVT